MWLKTDPCEKNGESGIENIAEVMAIAFVAIFIVVTLSFSVIVDKIFDRLGNYASVQTELTTTMNRKEKQVEIATNSGFWSGLGDERKTLFVKLALSNIADTIFYGVDSAMSSGDRDKPMNEKTFSALQASKKMKDVSNDAGQVAKIVAGMNLRSKESDENPYDVLLETALEIMKKRKGDRE